MAFPRSPSSPHQRFRVAAAGRTLLRCLVPFSLILLATTWPFSRFQDHAHWADVEWIPFTEYQRPFDVVANVLLFLPFGLAFAWGGTPARVRRATLVALALTLSVELSQVYTHNRAATVTDLMTNTAGAWLGARLGTWRRRGRAGAAPSALPAHDRDELRAS